MVPILAFQINPDSHKYVVAKGTRMAGLLHTILVTLPG